MATSHTQIDKALRAALHRLSSCHASARVVLALGMLTPAIACEESRGTIGSGITGSDSGARDASANGGGSDDAAANGATGGASGTSAGSQDAGMGGTGSTGGTGSKDAGGASGGASTGSKDAGTPPGTDPNDPHQRCVDKINTLRATLKLAPLQRWKDAEACTNMQSAADNVTNAAHGNFGDCQESSQNTCPNWNSIDAVLTGCLDQMWAEGPPPPGKCEDACFQAHGHYINMTSTRYTKVACGFDSKSGVWSNQNFQ